MPRLSTPICANCRARRRQPRCGRGRLMASEHTLERVARGGRKAHSLGAEP